MMWREKSKVLVTVAAVLVLVWAAQAQDRSEGGAPPITEVRPLPPGGPAPVVSLLRRQADVLRGRAQEAQRMADELRRQAEELDQTAMRLMDQGPGPQPKEQVARELQEIKEAIGRAEREGRRQEAQELRRRAEQLMGQLQPMPTGPGMEERQEIKGQVERLLDEARKAKDQGRLEDAENLGREAKRLEQRLREPGPRERGGPGPEEIRDILRAAEQAEREGRPEDARRMREKAGAIEREFQQQRGRQTAERPGPGEQERREIAGQIERLRDESRQAKEQRHLDEAEKLWQQADRLEQQLRGRGPRERGEREGPGPEEIRDILRPAEQAEREGRPEDARRMREKAAAIERESQEQRRRQGAERPGPGEQERREIKGQGAERPGPERSDNQFRETVARTLEELRTEVGRLWQAVNESRSRPGPDKPVSRQ